MGTGTGGTANIEEPGIRFHHIWNRFWNQVSSTLLELVMSARQFKILVVLNFFLISRTSITLSAYAHLCTLSYRPVRDHLEPPIGIIKETLTVKRESLRNRKIFKILNDSNHSCELVGRLFLACNTVVR